LDFMLWHAHMYSRKTINALALILLVFQGFRACEQETGSDRERIR